MKMLKILLYIYLSLTCVLTHAQQQPRLMLPVGHTNYVNTASFSSDGRYVVTASDDHTAIIWDALTGKLLHKLQGHIRSVVSATFSPNGNYVLTASDDGSALIWDVLSGNLLHQLEGHLLDLSSASFSSDGKYVVTASYDRTASVWDVSNGKLLYILEGHTGSVVSASFSPDGKCVVTASWDSTARIWDALTGKLLHQLKGHLLNLSSASFSSDGKYVVTASYDKTARVWDASSGKTIHILDGHNDKVVSASFSPNNNYLVTSSRDDTVRIWDVLSRKVLYKMKGTFLNKNLASLSFDGKYIATASHSDIYIWDVESGKELMKLKGHRLSIKSVIFSNDDKYIVSASSDNTACIWDISFGKELYKLGGQSLGVQSAVFSPNGKNVITTFKWDNSRMWDITNGKILYNMDCWGCASPSFSPDGKYIIMASMDSSAKVWDASIGKELHHLKGHTDYVNFSSFSPDGKYVVTASDDSTARIWEASTGKYLHQLEGHTDIVSAASFSPDGKYVVTASRDNTARVWDASTGKLFHILKGHTRQVASTSFSPDGKYVVTASYDNTARIWDASSGKELYILQGHTRQVASASFSTDGKYILTASYDKSARIWSTESGKELKKFIHSSGVVSAYFSSNVDAVITTTADNKTNLWEVTTGKQLYTRLQLENDDWLVYDEDYHFDGTPGAIEKLYFVCGLEVIDLGQLKDSLWIPGLAEKIMDNQPLLINDKPAPKLSNLNICNLTPVIEQLEPDKNSKKLRFRITPRNGGLGATEVYINNNLTYTYQPNQLEQQTENKKKVYYLNLHTDTLKGYLSGNRHTPNPLLLKSKVKGSGIYSRGVEVTISNDLDKEESPAFYGVFVGVNDYGNSDGTNENKYRNLKMAAKDAEDLASAVEATARNLFKDSTHIYRITGNNGQLPTREVLQKTLDEIGKKAKASDVLYIFFAGHGDIKQLKGEEQIRFMLYRADKINPETSSFGVQDLMEWCRPSNLKAQKRVFVFDACHSGKFSQEFAFGRGDDDGARIRQLDKLKDKNGMIILAASAENEEAYEDETLNQGVLTYNLLQVMQMQKNDSSLIVRGWFDETIKLVEEYSRANGNRQHPNSFGDGRFEIGNINEQVRKTIQITAPKIRIGECALVASDDLSEKEYPGLDEKLNAVFRNTTRGDGFVYSELKSKSYSIKGAYTSSKKQIKLRYKLYFGDQPVGNPLTLILDKSKSTDEDIVVEIEKSIRENIRKLK